MTEQKVPWELKGDCVEGCTSPPACPAYWNSPTQAQFHGGTSQCEGVWTFNIKEGKYGNMPLAGFKVSFGFNSPSPFPGAKGTTWKAIIYIDQKANAREAEALEKVFRTCWSAMGEVLMVKRANIEFQKELVDDGPAAKHFVKIDNFYNFAARPFRTADKKPRYVNSFFGGHINIGTSEINQFEDADLPRGKWNAPGMSNSYFEFVVSAEKPHWLP
jgi:hypothetical protein